MLGRSTKEAIVKSSMLRLVALGALLAANLVPAAASAREPSCATEEATHVGTEGDDVIQGTSGDDVIVARGGNDAIRTFAGNDIVCAGSGDDRVRTGRGFQDQIYAGSGDDVVHGGPGRNLLVAGPGSDRMYGSSHFDNFESPGRTWEADRDLFVGRGRSDSFAADPGDDTFRGGDGVDRVWFFRSPSGIQMDLRAGTSTGDGRDTLTSIENVVGSRHDDTIYGDRGRNDITTSMGDDVIYGRGGNDMLGDDGGSDEIAGGAGADQISTAWCVGSSDAPFVCQTDEPAPDRLVGGRGNDVIGSGPGDDVIDGNEGNDRLVGGDGTDDISGGEGDDQLHGGTAAGSDREADDGKADELDGGPGADECRGQGDTFSNCEL